jgi:hypothetical protein
MTQMTEKPVRLATRVDRAVDKRLRLAATVGGRPLGRFLTEFLDEHLPSAAELADAIKDGAGDDTAQ